MLVQRNILEFIPFMIMVTVIFLFPVIQIYATENVMWKTFNDKNGLFTIKYPSNWIPQKVRQSEGAEVNSPIAMNFVYSGRGSSGAIIGIAADESIFTNITDFIDSVYAAAQGFSKYKLLQPIECEKYMINKIKACSTVFSYKNTQLPGKPIVSELDIGTIDEDGVQYVVTYLVSENLFDNFLPVVEEMVRSFNVTGSILASGGESTQGTSDSPELPPLTQSPTVKKV